MGLIIRIISHPEGESIQQWQYNLPDEGGIIGRSIGVNLQLNDSHRTISGIHATIKKNDRGYQLTDNSTNGTFINNDEFPLGKDNSMILNDGDVIKISDYQLLISCFELNSDNIDTISNNAPLIDSAVKVKNNLAKKTPSLGSGLFEDDPFEDKVPNPLSYKDNAESIADTLYMDANIQEDIFNYKPENSMEIHSVEPKDNEGILKDPFSVLDNEYVKSKDPIMLLFYDRNISISEFIKMINESIAISVNKLILDLSPENIESTYFSIFKPGFFNLTPDFWKAYKSYYYRQMKNDNLQTNFTSCFHSELLSKILDRNIQ
ncbi:FHA domain-containing protein [Moellerella wisconsensis]|uniref:FHA domain-containing protein n=1 Tax=Moellerella wisconsensis TaxID=158849 RepID=UPI0030761CA8